MATAQESKSKEVLYRKHESEMLDRYNKKMSPKVFDKKAFREKFIEIIEWRLNLPNGTKPNEVGAALANSFGSVRCHFSFDRDRPFTEEEHRKYNLIPGAYPKTTFNSIRAEERKTTKAKWDEKRRNDVQLFTRMFLEYLEENCGGIKENKLGVKIAVGDQIEIKGGHYHRLWSN